MPSLWWREEDSDIGQGDSLGVNHSIVSLSLYLSALLVGEASVCVCVRVCVCVCVCDSVDGSRMRDRVGRNDALRFPIMIHRCSITWKIKSKMLNLNQTLLMARHDKWSVCLAD